MMAIFSRDETYIYDRREWSMGSIIFTNCFWFFLASLYGILAKDRLFLCFYVLGPLFIFADHCSLRITITTSKMIFHQGFFFYKRTISCHEILNIIPNSSKYTDRNRFPSFFKVWYFSAGTKKPEFMINLRNNGYCFVKSNYVEEVMNAIKKIQPLIKID